MQVLVINDHGSITGGAAQVAITSLSALANLGIKTSFVSGAAPVDKGIDQEKIRVYNFGYNDLLGNPSRINAGLFGLWDPRCAERLRPILDSYDKNNTIVHIHNWMQCLSSSVIHEILKSDFKIVVTLHDYFTICPNGGLYNYVANEHCCIEPMSLQCAATNCDSRNRLHKSWRYLRHLIQNNISGMPDKLRNFITVSDYSENLLRPHLDPASRFFRVRNPIDIAKMPPSKPGDNQSFTFIGRLSAEKGPSLFAEAARNANAFAAFVGSGSEHSAILDAYPQSLLLGWQDRPGVISQIRKSRAIVYPSHLHETQGLAVTEAAALGVPAIVSDQCAAKDSVINGRTGLFFRGGDVEDLASKIAYLDKNPNIASRMGAAAYRQYWNDPSTAENHALKLIECYQNILNDV